MSAEMVGLPTAQAERYLNRQDFAVLLGVSDSTVGRWLQEGMPSETWGLRARRILPSRALAWLREREYGLATAEIAPATAVTARGHGPGGTSSMSVGDTTPLADWRRA